MAVAAGVNTFTTGRQAEPQLATSPSGRFVVAWQSDEQDGSGSGIYARRYDANGQPQGGEFLVNVTTAGHQKEPGVAIDANGDLVVVWQSEGQDSGIGFGVFARRFDGSGNALGGEFRVNNFGAGDQTDPEVASDADGDLVITWTSAGQDGTPYGVYARRYDAAGTARGDEFRVNSLLSGEQLERGVAMDDDGDFVVAWQTPDLDGSNQGVYARRYSSSGAPEGAEVLVNSFTAGHQWHPSVAMDSDGDFTVVWESMGQDGSDGGVYAQRFAADEILPEAHIAEVTPDPRLTSLDVVTLTFSEYVSGFDLADLRLSRDGGANLLASAQTLTSVDQRTFTLGNLAGLTGVSGTYLLTLAATGSGIADAAGNPLAGNANETWAHGLPVWLAPTSVAAWDTASGTLTLNGAARIVANPGTDLPIINANGIGAVLTIDPTSDLAVRIGGLHLTNGATATLDSLGGNRTANNHRVLIIDGADITIGPHSTLDLTDNDLIVDYSGSSPSDYIEDLVGNGANLRDWSGAGITSSLAALDLRFALGMSENASLPAPYGDGSIGRLFAGQVVDSNAVLVKFTWVGDLNLDGFVEFQDLSVFNTNYDNGLSTGRTWLDGDFNYDGVIDFQDLSVFYTNYDPNRPAL